MSSSRIAPMPSPAAATGALPAFEPWRGFAMRGVTSAGAGVVVAVVIWAMSAQSFRITLVYSLCISLMCWLFIDTGRGVAASWRRKAAIAALSTGRRGWPGWFWMIAIVVIGATLGFAAGNELGNRLLGLNMPGPLGANWRQLLTILIPAVTITYYFQSRQVIAGQREEVERAQRQAAEQQLMLLESQLEPHMLFNTLANLRALIGVDAARAQAMLDHLIAFLRASLAVSRERIHPLADEFARLADYLALMQIRMGPRLQTRFVLPPELAAAGVPPLLLQPLVENCIRHGLEPKVAGGRIEVSARREGATLVITVRDDGIGAAPGSLDPASFGLAHVRERLATLYGAAASFALESSQEGSEGSVATVRLPLSTPARARP